VRFTSIKLVFRCVFHEKVLVMGLGISRITSRSLSMQFHELTSKYLSSLSSSRMINRDLLYGVHEQHTENYCRNFTNKCLGFCEYFTNKIDRVGWKFFTKTIRVKWGGVHEVNSYLSNACSRKKNRTGCGALHERNNPPPEA